MIGLSFLPGNTQGASGQNPTQGAPQTTTENVSPIQTAIRTLSLRLPQMMSGSGGIAPQALLNSAGGLGLHNLSGGGMDLQTLLQQLFGGQLGGGQPPTSGFMPSVTPGGVPGMHTPLPGSSPVFPQTSGAPIIQNPSPNANPNPAFGGSPSPGIFGFPRMPNGPTIR